jgi:hypothetical protein
LKRNTAIPEGMLGSLLPRLIEERHTQERCSEIMGCLVSSNIFAKWPSMRRRMGKPHLCVWSGRGENMAFCVRRSPFLPQKKRILHKTRARYILVVQCKILGDLAGVINASQKMLVSDV